MYYHAGPAGITELKTLRMLIDDGDVTVDEACDSWYAKWGDPIDQDALLWHPTMDEVSLTTDLDEAREIASNIGGVVYVVGIDDDEVIRYNEEGYPVCGATSKIAPAQAA